MPNELFAEHPGEESQQCRSVSMNNHGLRMKLKGTLQRSVLGNRVICLNRSHKCPLHPRKRGMLVGEGILTCGMGYSLRLPIPFISGNSGQVQISLPKGPCDISFVL
jgi:hypothetical protein